VRVSVARLSLFLIWMVLWLGYVLVFFLTTQKGIPFEHASEAAWKMTYALLPIVSAFATYWFAMETPPQSNPPAPAAILPAEKWIPLFTITGVVNVIVMIFLIFGIILPDFSDPDKRLSYTDRADQAVKIMVFLAGFVGLPVGFLLGKAPASSTMPPPPAPAPSAT
jgi:hypothetical protein